MENDRTLPSASISEGSSKVMSRYWPDLNVQFDGFSNRNAVARSATSCLLKSLAIVTGEAVVVDISSPSRVYLPESAFFKRQEESDFFSAVSFGGFTRSEEHTSELQ